MSEGADLGSALLSDLQILERLVSDDEKQAVFVSPLINLAEQLGPSSLDLRLGTELTVTRTISETAIDLSAPRGELEAQKKRYQEVRRHQLDQPFVLHPGEFALANTLEYIKLPPTLAGRLEGRSSFGRLGIQVHATAGFVDPGFEGTLTWELTNCGRLPITLSPGVRLGQICFIPVTEVQTDYMSKRYSKYGRQVGLQFSQIELDPDRPVKRS